MGGIVAVVGGVGGEVMSWHLKKLSGEIYGPVDLPTLQTWAKDGRIAPEDQLSQDQKTWSPAPQLADLAMDWKVELRDGSMYGPLNVLAVKELVEDGSVSRRAKMAHKVSGEVSVVSEVLLSALIAQDAKLQSQIESLAGRLQELEANPSRPKAAAGGGEKSQETEAKLRRDLKSLVAERDNYRHKAEKWQGLYMDEQAKSGKREKDLLDELHQAKLGAAQGVPAGSARAPSSAVDPKEVLQLRQEVERWKTMYEQARAVAQAEQAKTQKAQRETSAGDVVPRSVLQEVERKLAQVEKSYQQLLRQLNRSLSGGSRDARLPPPDHLRRRDVS